jgi:hypothetical protein
MAGTIVSSMFRPQKTSKSRVNLYNTLAVPVLLHGFENWTIKARDARRITAAEIKYMRTITGYTRTDYKTKHTPEITKEPVLDKIQDYRRYGYNMYTECIARDYRG